MQFGAYSTNLFASLATTGGGLGFGGSAFGSGAGGGLAFGSSPASASAGGLAFGKGTASGPDTGSSPTGPKPAPASAGSAFGSFGAGATATFSTLAKDGPDKTLAFALQTDAVGAPALEDKATFGTALASGDAPGSLAGPPPPGGGSFMALALVRLRHAVCGVSLEAPVGQTSGGGRAVAAVEVITGEEDEVTEAQVRLSRTWARARAPLALTGCAATWSGRCRRRRFAADCTSGTATPSSGVSAAWVRSSSTSRARVGTSNSNPLKAHPVVRPAVSVRRAARAGGASGADDDARLPGYVGWGPVGWLATVASDAC